MEKWTKKSMPSQSTLRKSYLQYEYIQNINRIKAAAANNDIYIMIDETTDTRGLGVAAVLVGILGDNTDFEKPQLFNAVELEGKEAVVIAQIVTTAVMEIYGTQDCYGKLRLLITDAASNMIKAGSDLKNIFPNMLHVTCMAHGVQRVGFGFDFFQLISENGNNFYV